MGRSAWGCWPHRRRARMCYHAAGTIEMCDFLDVRTYIPEPRRQHRSTWVDKSAAFRRAVYGNRRRVRRVKGKALQRRRSEVCERTFAHVCETGGARRTWLRGLADVSKRYMIAAAAHNLGRLLRRLTGVGKPKALQGRGRTVAVLLALWTCLRIVGRHGHQSVAQLWRWIGSADAPSEMK